MTQELPKEEWEACDGENEQCLPCKLGRQQKITIYKEEGK